MCAKLNLKISLDFLCKNAYRMPTIRKDKRANKWKQMHDKQTDTRN